MASDDPAATLVELFGSENPAFDLEEAKTILFVFANDVSAAASAILERGLAEIHREAKLAVSQSASNGVSRHSSPRTTPLGSAHKTSASPNRKRKANEVASPSILSFFKREKAPMMQTASAEETTELRACTIGSAELPEVPSSPVIVRNPPESRAHSESARSSDPPENAPGSKEFAFSALVETFETIHKETKRLAIQDTMSKMFRELITSSSDDLLPSIFFCSNKIDSRFSDRPELGVGPSLLCRVLTDCTGRSASWISEKFSELGDLGDVAFEAASGTSQTSFKRQTTLFANKKTEKALSVRQLFKALRDIASIQGAGSSERKFASLSRIFLACKRPLEFKYLARLILGAIRTGAMELTVLVCAAQACIPFDILTESRTADRIHSAGKRKEHERGFRRKRSVPIVIDEETSVASDEEELEDEVAAENDDDLEDRDDPEGHAGRGVEVGQITGLWDLHRVVSRTIRVAFMQLPSWDVICPLLIESYRFFDSVLRIHTDSHPVIRQQQKSEMAPTSQIMSFLLPEESASEEQPAVARLIRAWTKWFLANCIVRPGIPVRPMLAVPCTGYQNMIELLALLEKSSRKVPRRNMLSFACEHKYDGMRAQVHRMTTGAVMLFSRRMENISSRYPEVLTAVGEWFSGQPEPFIMDVEIAGVRLDTQAPGSVFDLRFLPFQLLSTRSRKGASASSGSSSSEVPVCVVAFDLLVYGSSSLLSLTFRERRSLLQHHFREVSPRFFFAASMDASVPEGPSLETQAEVVRAEIEPFFLTALACGCEGLMCKALDHPASAYTAARRSGAWLKLKKDYMEGVSLSDSLDLVPIGAWNGTGRRAGWYSPFLLAVYNPRKGTFESMCRCMTGFSDSEFKEFKEFFSHHLVPEKLEEFDTNEQPDYWFDVRSHGKVWECRGADMTLSLVHTAAFGLARPPKEMTKRYVEATEDGDLERGKSARGVSLRFPRFIRERQDKSVFEASTSEHIAYLYHQQFLHLK
eukprot:ANDGO_05268.mRNA.1 DNA ligase 1